ncbi:poly(3-hydroxybutyrate) depolymerase [Gordonia amarae]|uniref:Putative esterase n=1 Tax=Gordonia amarae NBRC 15530 TaxID=1075090 RepID=G7GPI8_9ACTN|nr:PHB depolymerase family esterase [Gordonia amarae]MCS3879531.1 poly(3-hydroxybutyrate) depolymerase [Gordonia amarae]GAB05513.1 putative esterase [Gordonia amarae NBRC 15530]
MRRFIVAFITVVAALCYTVTPATAAPVAPGEPRATGDLRTGSLTTRAGTREFQVYVPRTLGPGRPLIVWLHGASRVRHGDPRELRRTSTLLIEADRLGYAVVAPRQSLRADPAGTWRIVDPANLIRGSGEASIVAGIVRRSIRDLKADPARVYVAGHSAGGAMALDVAALYPELFAGISTSAGMPFAADPTGEATRRARGGMPLPTFVVHGDRDSFAPLFVGTATVSAALGANGIPGGRPSSRTVVPAGPDPYRTIVTRYGSGQREVVSAVVIGADHPTGPGGLTVNGPALDRRVISFLLSKHR